MSPQLLCCIAWKFVKLQLRNLLILLIEVKMSAGTTVLRCVLERNMASKSSEIWSSKHRLTFTTSMKHRVVSRENSPWEHLKISCSCWPKQIPSLAPPSFVALFKRINRESPAAPQRERGNRGSLQWKKNHRVVIACNFSPLEKSNSLYPVDRNEKVRRHHARLMC